ncbi:MAG: GNVR domain-containing protein, partial [Bacteroidales bacterium]|nr:GNVR domain-containing protein [Bacteroidales bacterium]
MATIQKNNNNLQNAQDFIRIQDLLYLCLAKWHWFVLSLAVCLGVAVVYLLKTPPVFTRTASILIKDNGKGQSSAEMAAFSDLGIFNTSTNVSNEMNTLRSLDLMKEVVMRLHLDMNYMVDSRFHKKTIYGESLPVQVSMVDFPENESASFVLNLAADGKYTISDIVRGGESVTGKVEGKLNDTVPSKLGRIAVVPTAHYKKEAAEIYVSRSSIGAAVGAAGACLTIAQTDEKSNIISLSYLDVSTQRAEDILNTLIAVYNENWVKDRNQIAVSTSMFITDRLAVIESELGNVDNDISSFKSANLLPDVGAAAGMYMSQANEAASAIKQLNNQVYMARYIRNNLTSEGDNFQLLPANSGLEGANISSQISEYNNLLLERNNLVSKSSVKNPLVEQMDVQLAALRGALISTIDNEIVALNAQIKSQQSYGSQATSQIASNPKQAKYLLSVERQQKVKESLYLYLLQKREENELSQAFTAYNTRIITTPHGSNAPTAPIKKNILLVAFALGLLVPVVIIFVRENT